MKKSSVLLCGILFAALSSASAFADSLFNFSFDSPAGTANQFSGSGTFTVTELSTNIYTITGITGTVVEGSNVGAGSTVSIVSLLAAGAVSNNNNLLYYPAANNAGKSFDGKGVAFLLSDGSTLRLYNNNENLIENTTRGHSSFNQHSDITVTFAGSTQTAATPEPGTLMLFGTGALGLAGTIRRKLFA